MKNVDSKLLLGLIVGAAVGAAIGYLAATDKREQIMEDLGNVFGKVKDGVSSAVNKYVEAGSEMLHSAKESATEVINKAKGAPAE